MTSRRLARAALAAVALLTAPGPAGLAPLGLAPLPAFAQDAPPRRGGAVSVSVGEGRLIRFSRDVTQVLVADQAVADVQIVSPRVVFLYGRRIGQTTLHAVDSQDGVVASSVVRVDRSAGAAQAAVPTQRSAVQMEFVGERLMVQGPVRDLGEAMEVEATARAYSPAGTRPLDRTRLASSQQVALRVRFAEVSRNDLNRIGLNWNVVGSIGSFAFNFVTGAGVAARALGAASSFAGLDTGETFGAISGGVNTRRISADALLDALQREGVVSLLAEPTLTAISGQTASFLAGGEVPIPVPQRDQVVTVEYKKFGVGLEFTPTVLPGDRIGLRVAPEVSEVANTNVLRINGYSVPSFITRRADTTVELASGQTLAIAGLFQRRLSDGLDSLPLLGDVPVLGALFRSSRFQRAETELLILITPYIVDPVRGTNPVPTPADRNPPPMQPVRAAAGPAVNRGLGGFLVD
ncbi:type II and III secretion system protein family protein [Pararoseomonas sp. SCSIO 73927]|uniref:type II and III secretion system protein family protein n=1 Tax=Pararoseomonas sp. SCSIO 73927 TaxID=3114537 RepID=UPI0030D45A43